MTLPAAGVLLPESLGAILDAQPGDEIEIDLPGAGVSTLHLPLTAFTSDTLGNLVFMRDSVLRDALGADADAFAGGLFDTATIRFATGADPATVAAAVSGTTSRRSARYTSGSRNIEVVWTRHASTNRSRQADRAGPDPAAPRPSAPPP